MIQFDKYFSDGLKPPTMITEGIKQEPLDVYNPFEWDGRTTANWCFK